MVLGVCWRCDCVACLGSLGASVFLGVCSAFCRLVPLCAALRCIVQHFAVIVPFNAVLCRAEKASRHVPEPSCARAMHLCRVMCRFLPLCAALRCIVQHFAVIVPFNAVLCRAEQAP